MTHRYLQRAGLLLVVVMLVSSVAAPAMAATLDSGGQSEINTAADSAHDPRIDANVTRATFEMGWETDEYENDAGDVVELNASINDTYDNPYDLTFSDVEASAYGAFPRSGVRTEDDGKPGVTRDSGWAESEANTAGSGTISNSTTAQSVDAVQITTSSQVAGDNYAATFDAFNIDSDVDKREIQLVVDVNTLESGADVNVTFNDSDGDYVSARIDPDANYDDPEVIANSTGEGYVFQRQIGDLQVNGSGDGTMDEINATSVTVQGANADIKIAALDVERTSPWKLGEQRRDTDGDDNLETVTVRQVNQSGDVHLHSLSSMGTVYDSATLHDLTTPMSFYSSMYDQEESPERFNSSYENASQFPSFDTRVTDYRRIVLPSAFDLSYASVELRDVVVVPENRYQEVEYATQVDDTNFTDISWSDATSSYSTLDDDIQLASGFGAGDEVALHYDYVVTGDEADNLMDTSGDSGGGGGGPVEEESGGFFSSFWNRLMTGLGAILVALGLKKKGGN